MQFSFPRFFFQWFWNCVWTANEPRPRTKCNLFPSTNSNLNPRIQHHFVPTTFSDRDSTNYDFNVDIFYDSFTAPLPPRSSADKSHTHLTYVHFFFEFQRSRRNWQRYFWNLWKLQSAQEFQRIRKFLKCAFRVLRGDRFHEYRK